MHLKIGNGHEERHRKESYVVFIPKKLSYFALAVCDTKLDEQNGSKCLFKGMYDFISAIVDLSFLQKFLWFLLSLEEIFKAVFS